MCNQHYNNDNVQSFNILKTRDDPLPVWLTTDDPSSTDQPSFRVSENSHCSWAKPNDSFGPDKLRPRIEPWLTALCQSEHLSLLLGSGLTNAVHQVATSKTLSGMDDRDLGNFSDIIDAEAKRSAEAADREEGNIEDQVRAANELLRGLEIMGLRDEESKAKANDLGTKLSGLLADFGDSILAAEQGIVNGEEKQREEAFNYLVSFLMSFASRTGTRERLHIFTTNYDRLIEAGAEAAGMHLLDRFVGSLAPVFRSSRLDLDLHYNPPGIRGEPRYLEGVARFTKLHGSLDWVHRDRNIRRLGLPFGADELASYFKVPGAESKIGTQLMIYPNGAKDRETTAYPYADLFRDFAAAACRPNHTLIAFGYGFGDEHINRVIEDMLTISSTHLVVISHSDTLHRIRKTYERLGRHAQISLLIGDHIGDFKTLVDHYLPKPAIDRTTFRMAELLKSRWGANQGDGENEASATPDQEGSEF